MDESRFNFKSVTFDVLQENLLGYLAKLEYSGEYDNNPTAEKFKKKIREVVFEGKIPGSVDTIEYLEKLLEDVEKFLYKGMKHD